MLNRLLIAATAIAALSLSVPGVAAVSAADAEKLKSTLTPLGGERAGSEDGSIPAWDGGYTSVPTGYKAGDKRAALFADEKPILTITVENMAEYTDKISEGMQALMKKYPESFRINVYPTHRTAAAPDWVYENTFKNATSAKTTNNGLSVEGAYGGVPFPIPQNGFEVMWNHLLRWRGVSVEIPFRVYVGATDGSHTLAVEAKDDHQFPYYYEDGSGKESGEFLLLRQIQTAPPFKAGEQILLRDPLDLGQKDRKAWQYLSGQRRVRRAPTIAFDTPDFVASGQNYFDEVFMFLGSLERYDWKLLEKKEMFVPYNNNSFLLSSIDEVLAPHHLNPEKMRWELHRVWVVEANLASGKRHVVPKRRFYVDEDSWSVLLADGYDAEGTLWRAQHAVPFVAPGIPAVVSTTFTVFNLQAGTWLVNNLYNEQPSPYKVVRRRPVIYFSPDALAGAGVR
jgi:hypothetical protein